MGEREVGGRANRSTGGLLPTKRWKGEESSERRSRGETGCAREREREKEEERRRARGGL